MSKKILALILSVAMVCSLCVVPAMAAEPQSVTFADARGTWAESSINRWAAAGIVAGDDLGNFNPEKNLRRCELAIILTRLLGLAEKARANTFSDVAADDWYADGILKCAAAGIMEGWDGMAHPLDPITREQAITMVGRALGVKSRPGQSLAKFTDATQVSAYAVEYMAPLTAMGILDGVGDGTKVLPKNYIDRASTVALLDKAIAAYVTVPGEVKVDDANKFIIVNATAGDVTLSGTAAGVLVTAGNKANVKLSGLTVDTVKVDAPVAVSAVNSTNVGSMDVNAPATVTVDSKSKVDAIDTSDAPSAKVETDTTASRSSGGSGGGGGGGGGNTPATTYYTVTVDTDATKGTVQADRTKVTMNTTVTLTVTPAEGYELDTLTVTGKSGATVDTAESNGKYTFTMPGENVTVYASFKVIQTEEPGDETVYNITVDTVANGTVTVEPTRAKAGAEVTLTVTPDEGYELAILTVDGKDVKVTDNTYTFEMPAADVTVTATFKAIQTEEPGDETVYNVAVDTVANGTVTANPTSAKAGETVTLTVTPDEGYELATLTVDGKDVKVTNNTYTFEMPAADVAVTAAFKKTETPIPTPTTYTVTVADGIVGGTVFATPTSAEAGTTITLSATPAAGYALTAYTVNGGAIEGSTFTMPASNVIVSATFELTTVTPETVTLTLVLDEDEEAKGAVENVSLKDVEGTTVEKGTPVTIVVEFKAGCDADEYTVTCDTDGKLTVSEFEVDETANTATATVTANASATITITVAAKPEQAALTKVED